MSPERAVQPKRSVGELGSPAGLRASVPAIVHRVLRSPGMSLDPESRRSMESRLGHDFSHVRVHADAEAGASARAVKATAYTVGPSVVFAPGRYEPQSAAGRRLLAHELAHTVHQRLVPAPGRDVSVGPPDGRAEREARQAGEAATGGAPPALRALVDRPTIQREPAIDLPKATPTGKVGGKDVIEYDLDPAGPPGTINLQLSNERASADYVDNRVGSVGFGIFLGGCYLYVTGLETPVFLPDSYMDLAQTKATAVNQTVHSSREAALAEVLPGATPPTYAFYRAVGGMSVPTVFSEATTPRIMATLKAAKVQLANEVQHEMVVLGLSIVGGMMLRGIISKILKVGTGPTKRLNIPEGGEPAPKGGGSPVETPPSGAKGAGSPVEAPPPAALRKGVQVAESAGASPKGGTFKSASAQTSKSMATSIRADIGESEAYKAALTKGEIGLERPQGVNVGGRGDFVTARRMPNGDYEIIVTDVKTKTVDTSKFPKPKTLSPASWGKQVRDAISSSRLKLGDPAVEKAIVKAADEGRIWTRQVNVDYSPSGGGSISGL